jgi:hypothetical protein
MLTVVSVPIVVALVLILLPPQQQQSTVTGFLRAAVICFMEKCWYCQKEDSRSHNIMIRCPVTRRHVVTTTTNLAAGGGGRKGNEKLLNL